MYRYMNDAGIFQAMVLHENSQYFMPTSLTMTFTRAHSQQTVFVGHYI